jgi:hypothetical protein
MKRIYTLFIMIGVLLLCSREIAIAGAANFVGAWTGEYCTMSSKDGLSCGKPMEIVIIEQQKDLVRGHISIKGKDYPLSGAIKANKVIDYTDALNSIGILQLTPKKTLQMKAVNRCLTNNAECAHSGEFRRKK